MLELVQAGQKVLALGVPVQQLIGLPLLLLIVGAVIWLRRRRR